MKKSNYTITFLQKSTKNHGMLYDYSNITYKGQMKPITICCPKHGPFTLIANNHIYGVGCNKCNFSRGETRISLWLEHHNIRFQPQKTFDDCKNYTRIRPKKLPFDFYLPDYNILIEFNGKHHFEPVPFNGVNNLKAIQLHKTTVENDNIKTLYANHNNIILIRIGYTDDIPRVLSDTLTHLVYIS